MAMAMAMAMAVVVMVVARRSKQWLHHCAAAALTILLSHCIRIHRPTATIAHIHDAFHKHTAQTHTRPHVHRQNVARADTTQIE